MHRRSLFAISGAVAGLSSLLSSCTDNTITNPRLASAYVQAPLVADIAALGAITVDANLLNPWGLAFSPTGILWVSNNHSGTSTLYDTVGARRSLVVAIPGAGTAAGAPTGIVFNSTADFLIPGSTKAAFIFAGEDGTITAWNGGATAHVVADRSGAGAVYKGLALAASGGANLLFATNFKGGAVDVFDASFRYSRSFTDPTIPAGYAPFGIHAIGGLLYVTFAKQKAPDNQDDDAGIGNGYVDVFNPDGTLSKHLVSRGTLNSPWAVVLAPAGFGSAAGDILVGNFGDGLIGAYDATTGSFRGLLHDASNASIVIPGLWDLTPSPVGTATTLFFSAGPSNETHGLIGTLKPQ